MPVPDFTPYAGLLPDESDPATFSPRASALFAWFVETGAPQLAALAAFLASIMEDEATVLDALDSLQASMGSLAGLNVEDLIEEETAWLEGTGTTEALISPATQRAVIRDELNAAGAAPIYGVRAWAQFDGSYAVAINGSGNIASIVRNSTGNYTVTFSADLPTADYAVSGTAGTPGDGTRDGVLQVYSRSLSSVSFRVNDPTNNDLRDYPDVSLIVVC